MLFKLLSFLPLALSASLPRSSHSPGSYDGYECLKINTHGKMDDVLGKLKDLDFHDIWKQGADFIDAVVPGFEMDHIKEMGLDFIEMHTDLGKDIAREKECDQYDGTHKDGHLPSDDWFDTYHPYEDHISYWEDLTAAFSENSEYFVAGQSVEGRDIFGYKLFGDYTSSSVCGNSTKPAVIWHGTVHAREWITTMTVEYIVYNMIKGYNNQDPFWTFMLNSYDFYVLPIVNPDGFVYSQEVDRLWRKNRSPPPTDVGNGTCYGVDNNRNWPFQWGQDGSEPDPCSQTYGGTGGASTPENTALVAHMESVTSQQDLILYIDWHSYSQLIISPFGYTCDEVPYNSDAQVGLANRTAAAIEAVYGTNYTTGPGCETLYQVSGGSRDYAHGVQGATYAYTWELRDEGEFGFVLPPEQIRPNCEEVLAGVSVMLATM